VSTEAACASVAALPPTTRDARVGFRCCVTPP